VGTLHYLLHICALALLPLSRGAPELTSAKIQVAKRRSGKITGGGAALWCAPPYLTTAYD